MDLYSRELIFANWLFCMFSRDKCSWKRQIFAKRQI